MINKESLEKAALKVEQALGLMCIYVSCMKVLDWFKTLYVGDISVFKSVIAGLIAVSVIIFFFVTWKKTHNIAKHFYTIFCCICIYLHFDVLMTCWWAGCLCLLFAGCIVIASIQNTINRKTFTEEKNEEFDFEKAFLFVMLFFFAQGAFWSSMYS